MSRIINALGCGLVILALAGCANPRKLEISAKPVERPELVLPSADQLNMRDVQWVVITPENYEEVFARLKGENKDLVLFGLTDEGYERLALNLSDVRAYIQQQRTIIAAYERYYKQAEQALDDAQSNASDVNRQVQEENTRAEEEENGSFWNKIKPF